MVLPPVVTKSWDSFKKFSKKYEAVISVLFSVLPVIGQFVSKTIIQRVVVAALGLSAMGLVGIANQEDFKGTAYRDGAGIPTVGFGSIKGVKMGDTITVRQALTRLSKEVKDEYEVGVHQCVKSPLYPHEYDTYVRVTYNIGVSAFCSSTMVKRISTEDYIGACEAIKLFNKVTINGKKVVSRGLSNLRVEQVKECLRDPNA